MDPTSRFLIREKTDLHRRFVDGNEGVEGIEVREEGSVVKEKKGKKKVVGVSNATCEGRKISRNEEGSDPAGVTQGE